MPGRYPRVEPHDTGFLAVGDGNVISWETCGNPDGKAALVLHGGPGSGCSPGMRRFFDPRVYRVVLFDQRGCGRSRPHAAEPATDLSSNTTDHLIGDVEELREHLGIERWLVFGVSWGCTLGLAYAELHPQRVTGFVASGITAGRRLEIDWLYGGGLAPVLPVEWERFRSGAGAADDGDLVAAYHRLLEHPDPQRRMKAARDWSEWDWAIASTEPIPPLSDPAFQLARARICAHYFTNNCFLEDGELIANAHGLRGIPGVLINGRLDIPPSLITAWELGTRWPDAEVVVVPHAGHSTGDAGMADAIVAATDRFAIG